MIDLDPEEFRRLGYRAIDLLAAHLAGLPSGPARPPLPDEVRRRLAEQPLPEGPTGPDELLDRVARDVLAYPMGNGSPRFFAWVNSTAAPLGMLGDLLAAGLNPSVAGGDHAGTYVELAVLAWLKQLLGYPADAGAVLTSGGSVASLVGLGTMRHVKTGGAVRESGLDPRGRPLVTYLSTQGHSCLEKDLLLLGFGSQAIRRLETDAEWRFDLDRLAESVRRDRADGLEPACVAASAGTVNTGAIDPLDKLADFCQREGLWLHVDAAYGGAGALADQTAGLYAGLDRADSVAVDPHKWMYIPVECGCALVRDRRAMRDAFSLVPPYLRDDAALPWFSEFTIQQTRGFRALKLWLVLQQVGAAGYRQLVSQDIAHARQLQALVREAEDFELVAAGPLSIACFRYRPAGWQGDAAALDRLNRQLLDDVQREGWVYLTGTELAGRFVLRACIVNFRTQPADLAALVERLRAAGRARAAAGG